MARKREFGSIRRLPSKRWQAHYTGPDTQRYKAPHTFDSRVDAEAWLTDIRRSISSGDWEVGAGTDKPVTAIFGEYAEAWLASRPLKARTRSHYRQLLDRQINPTVNKRPVKLITPHEVRVWHASLGDAAPTQRAHAYGLLRTILGQAVADGEIRVNPCHIRGAGNSKRVHKIAPASLSELTALTEALPRRYRGMVLIAAWCGLRYGEITELRRKDLDLASGVIHVRRAVVHVDGAYEVGTPKSDAGTRDVHIPRHLIQPLQAHLDLDVAARPEALLFPSSTGTTHLASSTFYRSFYKARQEAGRPDLRFHDLRHTQAVLAASTGASLAELMARLGHSTPGAAMRYQHAAQERDRAIADALADFAGATAIDGAV